MGVIKSASDRLGMLAVLVIAAALPAVTPVPYPPPNYGYPPPDPYPPSYTPPYQPEYQPSYTPPYQPEYQASYPPPYQPEYYPAPEYPSYSPPAYSPPAYTPPAYSPPAYSPPAYTPPAYTPTYQPQYVQYAEYDSYEAVTYLELNESIHCGVLPSTNDELYQDNQQYNKQQYGYGQPAYNDINNVQPYAKSRWVVLITDDYYNYVCTGVIVQNYFILTSASCVTGPLDKYRVRFGDWDILTDYNEYEAYKNFEARICKKFPVQSDSYSSYPPPQSYGYNPPSSDLVLLEIDNEFNYDKYPQVAPICLPVYPTYYPQSYSPPAYSPPAYSPPAYSPPAYPSYNPPSYSSYSPPAYSPPAYSPPAYTPPSYYPETYYSECWVVGWYAPPTTELKNHPKPTAAEEQQYGSSYGGYSKPNYPTPQYYEEYYTGYDQSRILRKAKVKEIKCPSYGYGSPSYGGDACYVGVEGYDTCVADKGAGVYCVVPEKNYVYDSGYTNYDNYQPPYAQQASYPQAYGGGYEQSYYKKEIKAIAAAELPRRNRAVLVAIVQKLTQCSEYPPSYGSYGSYQQPQSKPITATKVNYKAVESILDTFWQNSYDDSCPALKSYYQEPVYQQSYPSYNPPAYNPPAYNPPSYNPPSYQSYPAVYEPSYPTYEPSYPTYEPSYPSYTPPSYEPSYNPPSYTPPSYNPPSYNPPSYNPPSYNPPSYNPPAYPYNG